jgi:hypothetical protein
MGQKIDRAQRKAAGHTCGALFHIVFNAGQTLRVVARPIQHDPGGHPLMGTIHNMGDGLTPKERKYLEKISQDLIDSAEILRKLMWRFRK